MTARAACLGVRWSHPLLTFLKEAAQSVESISCELTVAIGIRHACKAATFIKRPLDIAGGGDVFGSTDPIC